MFWRLSTTFWRCRKHLVGAPALKSILKIQPCRHKLEKTKYVPYTSGVIFIGAKKTFRGKDWIVNLSKFENSRSAFDVSFTHRQTLLQCLLIWSGFSKQNVGIFKHDISSDTRHVRSCYKNNKMLKDLFENDWCGVENLLTSWSTVWIEAVVVISLESSDILRENVCRGQVSPTHGGTEGTVVKGYTDLGACAGVFAVLEGRRRQLCVRWSILSENVFVDSIWSITNGCYNAV